MRSSVTVSSTESSRVTAFETAAISTGTRVSTVHADGLTDLVSSYGSGSHLQEPRYSADLRRILNVGPAPDANARPSIWISRARVGIASTGTLLVAERLAEDRICALLCTRHVLLLPSHQIVTTPADAVDWIHSCITRGLGYVTLISGPSRTSDIEKVLTLGAHGPTELHVLLVDGWDPGDD
jgi:L-lactate dehydrogenase complex protein LldG